jgi:hypothetical protein
LEAIRRFQGENIVEAQPEFLEAAVESLVLSAASTIPLRPVLSPDGV